jgi:hypothetical protein
VPVTPLAVAVRSHVVAVAFLPEPVRTSRRKRSLLSLNRVSSFVEAVAALARSIACSRKRRFLLLVPSVRVPVEGVRFSCSIHVVLPAEAVVPPARFGAFSCGRRWLLSFNGYCLRGEAVTPLGESVTPSSRRISRLSFNRHVLPLEAFCARAEGSCLLARVPRCLWTERRVPSDDHAAPRPQSGGGLRSIAEGFVRRPRRLSQSGSLLSPVGEPRTVWE